MIIMRKKQECFLNDEYKEKKFSLEILFEVTSVVDDMIYFC